MDADFSIELGPPREEAVLELPWDSGVPNGPRYLDLKRHPEMLSSGGRGDRVSGTGKFPQVNSFASILETAKCDAWLEDNSAEAEGANDASFKMAAYVDLVFAAEDAEARVSFFRHEELVMGLVARLARAAEEAAAVELIVRRCYYHQPRGETRSGFYVTAYVFGYGDDEEEARRRWRAALRALARTILESPGRRAQAD